MEKFYLLIMIFVLSISVMAELTFWTTETESNRQTRIKALATIYEAQTGIKVNVVPIEENDLMTQIPVAKNSGTLPDILEAGIEPLLLLASENFMDKDLNTKIVDSFGDIYPGAKKLLSDADGSSFAVPFHAWVQGLWYRKDWFEPRDLGNPYSWHNILTAAKALNDPAKGVYGIIIPKKANAFTQQVFTEIALANGARPMDAQGNLLFDSKEMIESFRFYKELGKYSKPGYTDVLDALKGYLSGETAMTFYSTYIMDDIAVEEVQKSRIDKFDADLVLHTGFANKMINIRPTSYGQMVGIGILNTSKDKSNSEDFIKFLMSPKNYVYWLHMAPGGMNPTRSSIAGSDEFLDNPILQRYGKEKMAEIVAALNEVERFEFIDGKVLTDMSKLDANFVIGKAINYMFANDWSPQQTAAWAQTEAKRVLGK